VRRIEKLCRNLTDQLLKDVSNSVAFSLQLDESTDIRKRAQLLVFIREVFEDFIVKKELVGMISLKGSTTGQKILNFFYSSVTKSNVPLHKLVSITTDRAKSVRGQFNCFIAICRQQTASFTSKFLQAKYPFKRLLR
jgi:hypothetical protein